jgi:hypothetical protein
MARKKKSADRFPIEPEVGAITTMRPGYGNPTDVRTYHAPVEVKQPLAQTAKPLPFGPGGEASREGHKPSRKDCGDVHVRLDAVRPNPDVDTENYWNSVGL